MHIVFSTRGILHDRNRFVDGLANMHLPWSLKNDKGEIIPSVVQNHLQPIELWSLVIPEENLDTMIRTLGLNEEREFPKVPGAMLRKALNLKKIPFVKPEGPKFPLYRENVEINGIGIREDNKNKYGNEQL